MNADPRLLSQYHWLINMLDTELSRRLAEQAPGEKIGKAVSDAATTLHVANLHLMALLGKFNN